VISIVYSFNRNIEIALAKAREKKAESLNILALCGAQQGEEERSRRRLRYER